MFVAHLIRFWPRLLSVGLARRVVNMMMRLAIADMEIAPRCCRKMMMRAERCRPAGIATPPSRHAILLPPNRGRMMKATGRYICHHLAVEVKIGEADDAAGDVDDAASHPC